MNDAGLRLRGGDTGPANHALVDALTAVIDERLRDAAVDFADEARARLFVEAAQIYARAPDADPSPVVPSACRPVGCFFAMMTPRSARQSVRRLEPARPRPTAGAAPSRHPPPVGRSGRPMISIA